ncbi:MAG: hypothetical protein CMK89_20615 [Pseudomonadales bacterium]|nr:hypothetical protein [Pseudomonadales bacterium]
MSTFSSTIDVVQDDLADLQALLDALPGSNDNTFSDNSWRFKTSKGYETIIDFESFSTLSNDYPEWSQSRGVDLIFVTKRVWLSLIESATENLYATRLSGLGRLWTAFARNGIDKLTRDNITEVIVFILTHQWHQGRAIKSNTVKTYVHFYQTLPLQQLKWALEEIGIAWISRDITEAVVKKYLKQIIPELTDEALTYRDWFEGGSFNLLTLDYGRFYVEHCLNFFNKHVLIATALARTYRAIPEIAARLNYDHKTVSYLAPRILQDYSLEELQSQLNNWSKNTIQRVHEHVRSHYTNAYREALFAELLISDSGINCLLTTCGIKNSHENIDRMRVIIWDYLQHNNKQETKQLLEQCDTPVSWKLFSRHINDTYQHCCLEACNPPDRTDYENIGLFEPNSIKDAARSYPRQLIKLVEAAGLTSFVALTGWRKSEFGFPFSAIKQSVNIDKLDEYAFPFRFEVDWHIYKTHGKIRQLREITFSTAVIAKQLQTLIGVDNDRPCLYDTTPSKRNLHESGYKVSYAVIGLWEHYVQHYPGFKMIDDYQCWQKIVEYEAEGHPLTINQQCQKARLLSLRSEDEWNDIKIDGNLKEAWLKCREEWPRLEFSSYGRHLRAKKDWLARYRNNSLRSDWSELLDKHLSQETKDWITSLTDDECRSPVVAKTVLNELLTDTLYPSPHAFRHMWAEAIYRRFDGDAGWMIRSQFKHISRTMWLAYIRDKSNRRGHQRAKTQVISSLVQNYLNNKTEGYAGQLHVWLRRLFKKTSVMTAQEQLQFANRIATKEIEDIKANPWGYCLLKRRTRQKAKCAEMGEPMRHNASPELCLGCIHNLMQTDNVEWSILHIHTHVEALKNPVVPDVFKASSYELVKNVTRHVRTLNSNHEALPELDTVLNNYKLQRAK